MIALHDVTGVRLIPLGKEKNGGVELKFQYSGGHGAVWIAGDNVLSSL